MYPPEVIHALKEALRHAYWYKDDLRRFLIACEMPNGVVANQGWHDPQEYKVRIAGKVIDELMSTGEQGLGPMRRLIQSLLDIPNFDHLRDLEDGAAKVSMARNSVETLRNLVTQHDASFQKTQEESTDRASRLAEVVRRKNEETRRLQLRFNELIAVHDERKRGRLFEKFLYDLFAAHDLNPRGAFTITGEQIDGAFELEGTQFLLEAKWEKLPLGVAPIDTFSARVERKLDNTLGLFVSLSGFTGDGLEALSRARPSVILMDGQDLAIVLQGFVDFRDLLKRKIRHAAQTGNPFLRALDPN